MAGMLPGVEAARRRRFHNTYNNGSEFSPSLTSASRRPSFCLYATSCHKSLPYSSMRKFSISQKELYDESRLGTAAREAKKRLDERLQPKWRSQTNRNIYGEQNSRSIDNTTTMQSDSQSPQVTNLRKHKSKRPKWLKINWRSCKEEECAVCLEQLNRDGSGRGETLMELECGHRFHTKCLEPWLEGNAHCPCCRNPIPSS